MILRHSILMYNIFEGHFDPLRLSKIGMAHPVNVQPSIFEIEGYISYRHFGKGTFNREGYTCVIDSVFEIEGYIFEVRKRVHLTKKSM